VVVSVMRVLVMMMSGWIALWGFTVCVCVWPAVCFSAGPLERVGNSSWAVMFMKRF
jgi:hypothetical protein